MTGSTTQAMEPLPIARALLSVVVVEGVDAGASIVVAEPRTIGTSERSDLILADRAVSRRHLDVEPSPGGLRVRDAGSRNGTRLVLSAGGLDAVVHDVELGAGAELRIGATRLRIESDATGATDEPVTASRGAAALRTSFGRFLGAAPSLAAVYQELERASLSEVTVLLEGESGAGKELLAEAIHEHSPRSEGPFVVVDCGAVPESLIESELFGHERGAFTGADKTRSGPFEQARGGTIFLDEIGELPLAMQTRLLRVLDRRQVRRVGSAQAVDIDVRVIAATNRNLEREVEEGRFRLDLFHRLAVVTVRVPPLRERPGDIELLARAFVQALGADETLLTVPLLERMRAHPWPGNARELRNHVERLVILGDLPLVEQALASVGGVGDPMQVAATSGLPYRQARAMAIDAFTSAYARDILARHDGNVSRAARAAGIARRHLQRLKT